MNDGLLLVLSLSLSGSILALLLFAVRAILKHRLSHTWQYYIWLVVVLRLLLPVTPQLGFVREHIRQPLEYLSHVQNAGPVVNLPQNDTNLALDFIDEPFPREVPSQQAMDEAQLSATVFDWRFPLQHAWIPWLGVAIVLLGFKAAVYLRFKKYAYTGAREIASGPVYALFQDELAIRGIRRNIPLYLNDGINSPMLLGIFRPAVIVPALNISDEGFRHIVRHELTHYKRQDYLYKWLVQLALCLHWFNPLVHLMARQINKCCELSCDEAVVKALDEDGRTAYGDALMTSLRSGGRKRNRAVALTMSEDAATIKDRLEAIMSYQQKSWFSRTAALALTLVICCSFLAVGAYAAKPNNPMPVSSTRQSGTTPDTVQTASQQADPFAAYPPRDNNWSHISTLYQDDYYIVAGWRNEDTLERYAWSTTVEIGGKRHQVAMWDEINAYANDPKAMELATQLIAKIIQESDPGRTWEGSFWAVRDVFYQVSPDEIMAATYRQENLIGFNGILGYASDTAKERQLETAYNDRRDSYVNSLCNYMPDSYNGETLASRAARDGERTMFDSISKYVSNARRAELREVLDAAERQAATQPTSANVPAASDYSVLRYASVSVERGAAIDMDITWDGDGQVLAFYTKANFTEEELRYMVAQQILPLETNDYRGTEYSLTSEFNYGIEETMYLTLNGNKQLQRSLTAAESTEYYLYVIASNDAGAVSGGVSFGGNRVLVSRTA